jgi:SAM-dependent methyltransferase
MRPALEDNLTRLGPRLRALREAEPWPHFFDLRLSEWRIVLRVAGDALIPGRWLDVGSGNSATTELLAADGYRAVGIDLPHQSWSTHSYGRELHAQVWKGLGRPVPFAWGSAEALPFRADSFDGVFASYSLQYLPDIAGGFVELHRVLRPGGLAVLVVPTRVERLSAISSMWLDIACELVRRAARRRGEGDGAGPRPDAAASPPALGPWGLLKRRYPRFPLPTSDSPHRRYGQELREYALGAWLARARRAGFSVERVGTTSLTLRGLTQWVVAPWRLHRALVRLQVAAQAGPLASLAARVGESVLLVLRKGAPS